MEIVLNIGIDPSDEERIVVGAAARGKGLGPASVKV